MPEVAADYFKFSCRCRRAGVLVGLSLHRTAFEVTITVRPDRDLFAAYENSGNYSGPTNYISLVS